MAKPGRPSNHKKGKYDGERRAGEMSDWGLMRHRKRIPYLGQLPLPLPFSLFVSQIVAEEESERKKDLDLRTRARADHVCVCLDDRNWASHRNGMRPKVAGASRRVRLPALRPYAASDINGLR